MSTRSTTTILEDETPVVCMYRHSDGYPTGHGLELAEFLNGFMVVNGIGAKQPEKIANGMGCLAAQIVGHFKEGPGGIYLVGLGDKEEYNYTVYLDTKFARERTAADDIGLIRIKCEDYNGVVFDATPAEVIACGAKFPPRQFEECEECGEQLNHYLHAVNHYAKHHGIKLSTTH